MATEAESAAQQEVKVRISLDVTRDVPTFYVNYVEVSHTPHDLYLICGMIPGKLPREDLQDVVQNGEVIIPADVQLVVTAGLATEIIRALTVQLEKLSKEGAPQSEL